MADQAIAITAGSGTNVDTRTEGTNGNHRQVIVIGDPATNAGVAPVDGTLGLSVTVDGLGGGAIDLGAGAVASATLRATLASDDPAVTALQIIDDWDESDRAKVNPVVGQAGLAAGTGTDASNALRVSLATDIALPAGTNAIGKLAANSGVDIGDVDVTSLVPGTAASSLGKAEDAAHSSADVGVAALAVRRDAKAVGSGTDGDYSTLNVTANGDLRVDGGQAHIVRVAPTVTAGAYTADDCMGGEQTITNAARISGGGGILTGVTMVAEDDDADGWAANDVEILIFDSNPAGTYTDNNALDGSALTDADAALLLGTVLLDTKVDLGNVTMLKATNVNIPYLCSGSTSLFAVAVNRGAATPEATDALTFTYHMIRD